MDFYIVLGLQRSASQSDIKRAYRRLARRYHPDINPGDHAAEALFRRILEAYETLVDPDRRRRYDRSGGRPRAPESPLSFEGFDFSAVVEGPQAATFGELFADVFQPPWPRGDEPEAGADVHASATLSFEESIRGADRRITITRQEVCQACNGVTMISVRRRGDAFVATGPAACAGRAGTWCSRARAWPAAVADVSGTSHAARALRRERRRAPRRSPCGFPQGSPTALRSGFQARGTRDATVAVRETSSWR